jgi:hypothetical protein
MKKAWTRRIFLAKTAWATAGASVLSAQIFRPKNKKQPNVSPDSMTSNSQDIQYTRKVPVRYEADIVVVGGGIAGISAACAAAKSGAKVILIERFAVTGGMLTTGGVANFCGQMNGQGEVFDSILTDLKDFQALGDTKRDSVFHYEILAIILQELLYRRKVQLLLHTRFVDARIKNGQITECLISGKSGLEAIRAKQFIDCTGEADVARTLGFQTIKGRPSDGLQLPMSLMFFIRHVDPKHAKIQLPEGWFQRIETKDDLPMTSIWPDGPGANAIKIKIPMFDSTNTESLTAAEIRARRRMMEVLDYFRRVEKKNWLLDHCSPIIGIREGCRILGDYVLTVDDLRAGRDFEDGVARGTYYLDGHKPDDGRALFFG